MPAGATTLPIPIYLGVHMRMAVDKPGRDDKTIGVDRPLRGRADPADFDDSALRDTNVGTKPPTTVPFLMTRSRVMADPPALLFCRRRYRPSAAMSRARAISRSILSAGPQYQRFEIQSHFKISKEYDTMNSPRDLKNKLAATTAIKCRAASRSSTESYRIWNFRSADAWQGVISHPPQSRNRSSSRRGEMRQLNDFAIIAPQSTARFSAHN
jgi:hypothetical protein